MTKLLRSSLPLLTAFLAAFAMITGAQAGEIYKKRSWDHAVNGYDVVSYFSDGGPVKGNASFQTDYLGESWVFSSQENLDKFKADPDKYRPAYGGRCAWAMASGKTAPGNPTVWRVENGTLYLNVSKGVQRRWFKDIPGFIKRADSEWPSVLASL